MVKLPDVLARARAAAPAVDDLALERLVRETIAACGLEVNARSGEVYDPAPRPAVPEQRNVRWSDGRRR